MKNYSVTTNTNLRDLCIRKQWFTCGSIEQYDKLFYANENGAPIQEIATIIWLCSDSETWCRRDILFELKMENEKYLVNLGVQMQARGERDSDEVYCGHFD